jgi:hypothetical protein
MDPRIITRSNEPTDKNGTFNNNVLEHEQFPKIYTSMAVSPNSNGTPLPIYDTGFKNVYSTLPIHLPGFVNKKETQPLDGNGHLYYSVISTFVYEGIPYNSDTCYIFCTTCRDPIPAYSPAQRQTRSNTIATQTEASLINTTHEITPPELITQPAINELPLESDKPPPSSSSFTFSNFQKVLAPLMIESNSIKSTLSSDSTHVLPSESTSTSNFQLSSSSSLNNIIPYVTLPLTSDIHDTSTKHQLNTSPILSEIDPANSSLYKSKSYYNTKPHTSSQIRQNRVISRGYDSDFTSIFDSTSQAQFDKYETHYGSLDLHAFKYQYYDLSNPHGVIISSYTFKIHNVCDSKIYLVAKDDTSIYDEQGNQGIAIDLMMNRDTAIKLGLTNVRTNMISIPLILKHSSYLVGRFSGYKGGIQRRTGHSLMFNNLRGVIHGAISRGHQLSKILPTVLNTLLNLFRCIGLNFTKQEPIPNFHSYYHDSFTLFKLLNKIDSIMPPSQVPTDMHPILTDCLIKCYNLKMGRDDKMYGSHVNHNPHDKTFKTPCGQDISEFKDYLSHPCTVRARSVGVKPIMVGIYSCDCCHRVYEDFLDVTLCFLFCSVVTRSMYIRGSTNEIKRLSQLKTIDTNIDGYGDYVPEEDITFGNFD